MVTAVLLTQSNIGWLLKATTDYLVGTLGGDFRRHVGVLLHHNSEAFVALVLANALVPLLLPLQSDHKRVTAIHAIRGAVGDISVPSCIKKMHMGRGP